MKDAKEYANVGVSIMVTSTVKELLDKLCLKNIRSQAKMITVLILEACEKQDLTKKI